MTTLTPDMFATGLLPGIEEPSLERSARQPVADPLWMVLRQAQFGEFQAQDAGSPAMVRMEGQSNTLTATRQPGAPPIAYDPHLAPLEPRAEGDPAMGVPDLGAQRVSWGLAAKRILRAHGLARPAMQALGERFALAEPGPEPGLGDTIAPVAGHVALFGAGGLDGVRLSDAMENAHPRGLFEGLETGLGAGEIDALAEALLEWKRSLPRGAHQGHIPAGTLEPELDILAPRGAAPAPAPTLTLTRPDLRGRLVVGGDVTLPEELFETLEEPRARFPGFAEIFNAAAPTDPVQTDILRLEGYHGGPLHWWHLRAAEAEAHDAQSAGSPAPPLDQVAVPTEIRFPGMPGTRLWSVEQPEHHYSALDPAPEDLARLVVAEFALSGAEGWMLVPLRVLPGSVTRITRVRMRDVFGREETRIVHPGATDADPFDFGGISGHADGAGALVVLPTLPLLQSGPPLEEVSLRRDAQARLVWAVQERGPNALTGLAMDGAAANAARAPAAVPRRAPTTATHAFRLATEVPANWVPFMMPPSPDPAAPRMLRLAALLDIARGNAPPIGGTIMPSLETLADEAVPTGGLRLERAMRRVRWTGGGVRIWAGRMRSDRLPRAGQSGLRHDMLFPLTGPERRPAPAPEEVSLRDVMRYAEAGPSSLRSLMQGESGTPIGSLRETLADMARKRTE